MNRVRNLSVAKRLALVVGIALVALAGFAGLSMKTLSDLRIGGDSFSSIKQNDVLLADVLPPPAYLVETLLESYRLVGLAETGDAEGVATTRETLARLRSEFEDRHEYWTTALTDETTRDLMLVQAYEPGEALFAAIDDELIPAVESGDIAAAKAALDGDVAERYAAHRSAVDQIVARTGSLATQFESASIETAGTRMWQLWVILGVAIVVTIVLCALVVRTITSPVRRVAELLRRVAAGDLSPRLELDTTDELGAMAEALNQALDSISGAMGAIDNHAVSLASASEELTAVSSQLVASARDTAEQAASMACAAEVVSDNIGTVAAGSEEMSVSIQEISKHATEAATVAADANSMAEATDVMLATLGAASDEIGSIVGVIASIAEQTNLLALNATIESARAGEAGKGYAVVAHEVKELATATAKATSDITGQVGAMRSVAHEAVNAITAIHETISRVGEAQSSIASAVEEQTAATNEIARNVAGAADGSSAIASNVSVVAAASAHVREGAANTSDTAAELARMASELNAIVAAFRR